MADVKYPKIKCKLSGKDGNVFNLIGLVCQAMKKGKVPEEKIAEFRAEVRKTHSYEDALGCMMDWVDVR